VGADLPELPALPALPEIDASECTATLAGRTAHSNASSALAGQIEQVLARTLAQSPSLSASVSVPLSQFT
jgi:hypothetical protein